MVIDRKDDLREFRKSRSKRETGIESLIIKEVQKRMENEFYEDF
jgi:hypothetical protein